MDTDAILHGLTHAEGLPRAALEAASVRRAELVPRFLEILEAHLAEPPEVAEPPASLFFIFHLFGAWRETAAYRPLARLLARPPEEVQAILGDGETVTSYRVMASVCDGDPQPLFDLIENSDLDEFLRAVMCDALALAVLHDRLDREPVARFLRDGFNNLEPQAEDYVWCGWQGAIARLGLAELSPLVKKAFDRGFLDPTWLEYRHFERDLADAQAGRFEDGRAVLFGDVVAELSEWASFSPTPQPREPEYEWLPNLPLINLNRGVGRNDPCPCGSGRKFKKCCLT